MLKCFCAQVIKYESVIHEFDPYFNYRVTQVCLVFVYGIYESAILYDEILPPSMFIIMKSLEKRL